MNNNHNEEIGQMAFTAVCFFGLLTVVCTGCACLTIIKAVVQAFGWTFMNWF